MGTPLTDLLQTPASLGAVTKGIQRAVERSLKSHPMRHLTRDEVKRRFDICVRWFKVLRMDKKLSIERCVDEMPKALRAELDGKKYEPHVRSLWMPGDG
jgi:hypothetical protein